MPLIQLARGDGEERHDVAHLLGAAEAAERQLGLDELGDAVGIGLLALVPRSARERDRPGRHAVHADVVRRQLLRQRLGQADLGGLHRVVGHAAAGFAAEDRRDDHDRRRRRGARIDGTTSRDGANGRKERLVEGLLPVGVAGRQQVAAAGQRHVVHQHVDAAEAVDGGVDDRADAGFGGQVGGHREHLGAAAATPRPAPAPRRDSASSPRAEMHT